MSIPPSKDVPPARRQPTEISLAEIENLNATLKSPPKKRGGKRWAGLFLIFAGLCGMAYWQWDWLQPRLKQMSTGAKSAIASVDMSFLSGDRSDDSSSPNSPDLEKLSTETPSAGNSASESTSELTNRPESLAERSDNREAIAGRDGDTSSREGLDEGLDVLLNHRRYEVADRSALVALNPDSNIKVQPEAQAAIAAMIAKAKIEGVRLGVISGFRTLEDQDYLYFDLKAARGQSAQTRAEVSAPPGYSEHHTGYAVDFIDESDTSTNLTESFDTTAAFAWLQKNAPYFNFEMSFPKGNDANVSYEPWHWRYVGNRESLELFYK